MPQIRVIPVPNKTDTYEVNVNDDDGTDSSHRVILSEEIYAKLPHQGRMPEDCLKAAFLFLLDREPKEMILKQFEFMVIGRYFPEFHSKFQEYLSHV